MTDPALCPCCGQEVPEALQSRRMRRIRNTDAEPLRTVPMGHHRNALEELWEKYPHGMPGSTKWWRHRTGHETGCLMCGGGLPANAPHGLYGQSKRISSNRRFCSNACRQRAYRIRKKIKQV